MADSTSAAVLDPAALAELERLLVELRVPAGEGRLWRQVGRDLLVRAGAGPVQPRHVDQALEAALARSADKDELQRIRRLGTALAAAKREARVRPTVPPAAEAPAVASPPEPAAARSNLTMIVIVVAVVAIAAMVILARGKGGDAAAPPAADAVAAAPTAAAPTRPVIADIEVINRFSPGAPVDVSSSLARGKTTLVEFFSTRCEPSREMGRVMDYLAAHRADLAIRQVDIDRPGTSGVDFDSPVAEQYEVHATPSFIVYDPDGYEVARGTQAKDLVRQWYNDEQLAERAAQVPEISEPYRSN